LAAHAWAGIVLKPVVGAQVIVAVEMPGQRDVVHGGLYQVTSDSPQLTTLIPDRAYPIPEWEAVLAAQPVIHRRVKTADPLIQSQALGQALLTLGHQQWRQGDRPPWQMALPYYG
jgi:hypothetical protein